MKDFRKLKVWEKDVERAVTSILGVISKSRWGSASELETLLLLAHHLKYLGEEVYGELSNSLVEIRKMLNALLQRL